jgi:DNA adenine methylase
MILRRLGNKSKIAKEIQKHFPPHNIYIELFFGSGGMFFNKPKAKYNFLNDIDNDVFNLFWVVMNKKEELENLVLQMPESEELFKYWKTNKETEPIKKALRFLFLSNYGLMGKSNTIRFSISNTTQILIKNLEKTQKFMLGCKIMNADFRDVFKKISFNENNIKDTFIYADPPYINTVNNYSNSFNKNDSIDLFNVLQETNCKWAMSEFDNEFILNQAKERNLNVYIIGERKNMKNRRTEILITNYKTSQISLF